MSRSLNEFRVLTFDCYGTLIDWETGIWDALQPMLMTSGRVDVRRDEALIDFGRLESEVEEAHPGLAYPLILEEVHRALADAWQISAEPALHEAFGASVPLWPAFPDTADALRMLKKHFKLVVLSNIDQASFAASNLKLGVEFDAVYTAEIIGSYKPSQANFHYLIRHLESDLGMAPADILHTAQSLYHDHVPARRAGLANAWIDRQRLSEGGSWGATRNLEVMPEYDFLFFSMGEMAAAL